MKRPGFMLLCVLCALALAAPATAAPGPSDFEMRAPAGAVAASSGGLKSHVLRAPGRFDLVGLRWSGRLRPTISVRARKAGGDWTKWTPVPSDPDDSPDKGSRERTRGGFSAPVWTGDADFVQYKLSRRVAGLRLHFVDVSRPTRHALTSRTTQTTTGGAQPAIQPRSAWGAEDGVPR